MIQLDNISVRYGAKHAPLALQPTSLSFKPGEIAVLLGASGAGKSTLLRAINHLVRPCSGKVFFDDIGELNCRKRIQAARRKMATIFQQHQLIGRHSLLQNVLTGRIGYHGFWASLFMPANDRQLALAALDRVGLLDRALDRVDQLSGGQQQRVGIARALVQQPRLILADEPVASLDPISAQHILQLIERVCRQDGLSAIISLHQPALARQFADRILGIAGGDIVFDGPPEKLQDYDLSLIYPATPAPLHCQLPDTVQFSTELV